MTSDNKSAKIKSIKIGKRERSRLSHQIATDFPNLKAGGQLHPYENRNHFYVFTVNDFGSYNFLKKIPLEGNQDKITTIYKIIDKINKERN